MTHNKYLIWNPLVLVLKVDHVHGINITAPWRCICNWVYFGKKKRDKALLLQKTASHSIALEGSHTAVSDASYSCLNYIRLQSPPKEAKSKLSFQETQHLVCCIFKNSGENNKKWGKKRNHFLSSFHLLNRAILRLLGL